MQNFSRRSIDRPGNGYDPLNEDLIYDRQPTQGLRVVNGGIEPRHMRKGSYVEDDTYAVPLASTEDYGALPTFPSYTSGGAVPDVSGSRPRDPRDQLGVPDVRRSSGRNVRSGTARRSLILGPQPQPQLNSAPYGNYQPAPKPRFPNPSSTLEYYRQQQQQHQSYSRSSRQSAQGLASPGLGRYSPPLEADEDAEDENLRSRSIMIGFEQPSPAADSNSKWTTRGDGSDESLSSSSAQTPSNLQLNSFPFPPPQVPQQNLMPSVKRPSSSISNSSTPGKRANPVSSYYSQASYVTPIPEEMSEYGRHGSFASSHAIPSSWGSGIPGLWIPSTNEELMSDGASSVSKGSGKSRNNDYEDFDEGANLVRQASMGRKQKPKLTNIPAPNDKSDAKSKSSKSETSSSSQSQSHGKRSSIISLKLEKSSAKQEKAATQPIGSPMEVSDELEPPKPKGFWHRLSQLSLRSSTPDIAPKPLRLANGKVSPDPRQKEGNGTSSAAGFSSLAVPQPALNRPRPPRLNMDAVREAEARGSLTSLPDLIRRATKLAAVLETGNRPDSRWGGSRAPSIMSTDTNNNLRYQESLSDILASFPPPLASGRDLSSRGTHWPLATDMAFMRDEDTPSVRRKRKICGLPLWAFILIVLLSLVVIAAAIILPIQFIGLAKDRKEKNGLTPETCAVSNPCLNGGLANVENGRCTCVCTNEFVGDNCGELNDPACTTFSIQDTTSSPSVRRNVTIGVALPRLFSIASTQYNITIDVGALTNAFTLQNTQCALQNALVTLNGRTSPSTSRSSTTVPLDENVIDFGRVSVLYLAQSVGMSEAADARDALSGVFAANQDYGEVTVSNSITIDLTNLRINNGNTIVGNLAQAAQFMLHKFKRSQDAAKRIFRRHLYRHS